MMKIYEKRVSAPALENRIKENEFIEDCYVFKYGKKPVFTASLDTDNKDLSVCEEWYCYDTDNKYVF